MSYLRREGSIVWATPPSTLGAREMEAMLGELEDELRLGLPYVLLFDMSASAVPDALQRRKIAEHMQTNADTIRSLVRGLGVIVPSALVRGAVTALFWIERPAVPLQLFATCGEAEAWAASLFAPPSVRG